MIDFIESLSEASGETIGFCRCPNGLPPWRMPAEPADCGSRRLCGGWRPIARWRSPNACHDAEVAALCVCRGAHCNPICAFAATSWCALLLPLRVRLPSRPQGMYRRITNSPGLAKVTRTGKMFVDGTWKVRCALGLGAVVS